MLLFGRKLVPPAMHFVAAVLVAVGTLALGILDPCHQQLDADAGRLRSGQRPVLSKGLVRDRVQPVAAVSLAHTVSAFYVTTAFVVLGVGAYTVRRGQSPAEGRMMLRLALWFLIIFVPIQVVLGDMHGLNTLEYQPAKLAAIEGLWDGGSGVPASIIAWPDQTRGAQPRRDRDPETRQPLSHPFVERRGQRPEGFPGRSAAAGRGGLFRLPHHGRHRAVDARDGGHRIIPAVARGGSTETAGICGSASSPSASASSR